MEETLVFVTREEFNLLKSAHVSLERRHARLQTRMRQIATMLLAATDDYLERPRTIETRESKRN
jgi:hypothetical protein